MDTEKPKPLRGKALQLAKEKIQQERTIKIMEALDRAKANRKTLSSGLEVPPLPLLDIAETAGTVNASMANLKNSLHAANKRRAEASVPNIDINEFESELADRQKKLTPHQMNLLAARESANRRFEFVEDDDEDDDYPFVEVNFDNPEATIFPKYVGKVARKVFLDVMNMYKSNGIENLLDTSTVLLYATTVEKFHKYERRFAKGVYEYTMLNPMSGLRSESPESKIHNATISSMKTLGSLLLMNPKSRGSSVQQKKQQTALEAFITSRKTKN